MRGLRADAKCLNRSSPAARLVPSESARCRVQTHRDSRVPSHTGQQIVEAVRWILVTHKRGAGKCQDRPPIDAPITKSYRPFGLRAVNSRVVASGRGSVFECVHRSFSAPMWFRAGPGHSLWNGAPLVNSDRGSGPATGARGRWPTVGHLGEGSRRCLPGSVWRIRVSAAPPPRFVRPSWRVPDYDTSHDMG